MLKIGCKYIGALGVPFIVEDIIDYDEEFIEYVVVDKNSRHHLAMFRSAEECYKEVDVDESYMQPLS